MMALLGDFQTIKVYKTGDWGMHATRKWCTLEKCHSDAASKSIRLYQWPLLHSALVFLSRCGKKN